MNLSGLRRDVGKGVSPQYIVAERQHYTSYWCGLRCNIWATPRKKVLYKSLIGDYNLPPDGMEAGMNLHPKQPYSCLQV